MLRLTQSLGMTAPPGREPGMPGYVHTVTAKLVTTMPTSGRAMGPSSFRRHLWLSSRSFEKPSRWGTCSYVSDIQARPWPAEHLGWAHYRLATARTNVALLVETRPMTELPYTYAAISACSVKDHSLPRGSPCARA